MATRLVGSRWLGPSRLFDLGLALALMVAGLAEVLVPFSSRAAACLFPTLVA